MKNGPKKSEHHLRFMPGQSFIQPLWLSKQRWHTLFEIAYDEEQKKQWAEACHMVENHHDWDSYEDEQQMMIYLWTFTCAKLTCIFKKGYWLSLMELPEDFGNVCEIERVTHLVNFSGIKGVEIKMQQRSLPKNGNKVRIKFAKMARRIGRLHELDRRLSRKQIDDETYCLMDKLFGHCEVQAQEVKAELHKLTQSYQKSNEQEKRDKISNWSLRLRQSIGAKSDWMDQQERQHEITSNLQR